MARGWTLTPTQLSENDVKFACLDFLQTRGYYPVKLPVGKFKTFDNRWQTIGEIGMPDYVVAHGRYPCFFLEFKRPGGKLSPAQENKIWELRTGYQLIVVVVDSAATLAGWLDEHEARGP